VSPTTGPLRILAVSGSLWTLGCIAFAAAEPAPLALGLSLLFIAAALLGIAEAVYAPTADALPLVLAPPGLAGRYTALHQSAWGVSSVVSPILASSLLALNPHAVWLVMGAIAGLTTIAYLGVRPALVRRAGVAGTSEPTLPTETPVLAA
jgi:Major Facilitator Superfamily